MTSSEAASTGAVSIKGRSVVLREFRSTDLDDSLAVVGDDRVTRWLSFDSVTRKQQEQRLAEVIERARARPRTECYLAVTASENDQLIGFVRLGFNGVKAAKLGCAISYDQWGKGLATDAVRSLITYGIRELGLHRITAAIGPENAASIAIVRRLNFTLEGTLRDHVYTNGAWRDSELYSMLASEWVDQAAVVTVPTDPASDLALDDS